MKICETSKRPERKLSKTEGKTDWDLLIEQTARFLAKMPTTASQVNCINAAIEKHGSAAPGAYRPDPSARYSVIYWPKTCTVGPARTRLKGKHGGVPQQLLFTWLVATVPGLCVSDLARFSAWRPWEPCVLLPLLLGSLADSGSLASVLEAANPPPELAGESEYRRATRRKVVAAAMDAVARQAARFAAAREAARQAAKDAVAKRVGRQAIRDTVAKRVGRQAIREAVAKRVLIQAARVAIATRVGRRVARDAVARQPEGVPGSRLVKLFRSIRWPSERTQFLLDGVLHQLKSTQVAAALRTEAGTREECATRRPRKTEARKPARRGERMLTFLRDKVGRLVALEQKRSYRLSDEGQLYLRRRSLAKDTLASRTATELSVLLGAVVRDGKLLAPRLTLCPTPAGPSLPPEASRVLPSLDSDPALAEGKDGLSWFSGSPGTEEALGKMTLDAEADGILDRAVKWLHRNRGLYPVKEVEQVSAEQVGNGKGKVPGPFTASQRQLDAFVFARIWEDLEPEELEKHCFLPLVAYLFKRLRRRKRSGGRASATGEA